MEDNNNPIYFECLEMTYDMENLQNCPPIILNVWDTDSAGYQSEDNYIGRAVIYLDQASTNLSLEGK